ISACQLLREWPRVGSSGSLRPGTGLRCPALKDLPCKSYLDVIFTCKLLRRPSIPTSAIPRRATAEPPSGTLPVAAENENRAWAEGFCVVKFHVPLVISKPFPLIVPLPATVTEPPPCIVMEEEVRLNTKPSTCQKLGTAPELNAHGNAIVTASPSVTKPVKLPS